MLRRFGVGMAPSAWDQVLTGSQRAGFKVDELLGRGADPEGAAGRPLRPLPDRITFPIRDQRGRVLGFGARALSPDSKPKYLNSPEGELYRKSHTLYGIDRARGPIAKARRAIVVEGYTDVLALHQAGVEEAVAIMGTAITPEQISMLAGLTDSVVLALDADRAGADAMIRAQKVARGKSLSCGLRRCRRGGPGGHAAGGLGGSVHGAGGWGDRPAELPGRRCARAGRAWGRSPGGSGSLDEVGPVLKAMGETALGFRRAGAEGGGPAGHRCEPGAARVPPGKRSLDRVGRRLGGHAGGWGGRQPPEPPRPLTPRAP